MFRVCISALRFSRLQSKVRSSVSSKEHARKNRTVLLLPTHFRLAAPPPKPPLYKQAPGGVGPKPPPVAVVGPGKVRV
jgi:hypothetical protein